MPNDLTEPRPVHISMTADPATESQPLPLSSAPPEFRRDPVTGRWVIVAPERSLRPMGLKGTEPAHRANGEQTICPFCPGQEYDTPNEVLAYREPSTERDGPGWRLRVVPNKFPAVRPIEDGAVQKSRPLFERSAGVGRHEVVVETPEHISNPAKLSDEQLRDLFRACRDRVIALADDPALGYASVFKNVGAEAGASLGHTHSQIIATPIVPEIVQLELAGSDNYYAAHRRCVFCDIVAQERAQGVRVIAETEGLVAFAPFAPRFAYEVWVMPRTHTSRYEAASESLLGELGSMMKRMVKGLDQVLAFPAYNWFLHTAPLRSAELPHYHWHFEIIPRTARPAGFEWGGGCFVIAVTPERAATELRDALSQ